MYVTYNNTNTMYTASNAIQEDKKKVNTQGLDYKAHGREEVNNINIHKVLHVMVYS